MEKLNCSLRASLIKCHSASFLSFQIFSADLLESRYIHKIMSIQLAIMIMTAQPKTHVINMSPLTAINFMNRPPSPQIKAVFQPTTNFWQ